MRGRAPSLVLKGRSEWLDESLRQFSSSRYQAIVRRSSKSELAPLEPDILGELFVLDWLNSANELEIDCVLRAAWSVSAVGVFAFTRRAVPDFPRHEALLTLIKPPDVTPLARTAWTSCVVDLLLNMPPQHLDLGTALYEEITGIAAQYSDDAEIVENHARAT